VDLTTCVPSIVVRINSWPVPNPGGTSHSALVGDCRTTSGQLKPRMSMERPSDLSPKFSPNIVIIFPPTVGAFIGLTSMMRGAGPAEHEQKKKHAASSTKTRIGK
jgi:hypothetical protein